MNLSEAGGAGEENTRGVPCRSKQAGMSGEGAVLNAGRYKKQKGQAGTTNYTWL